MNKPNVMSRLNKYTIVFARNMNFKDGYWYFNLMIIFIISKTYLAIDLDWNF